MTKRIALFIAFSLLTAQPVLAAYDPVGDAAAQNMLFQLTTDEAETAISQALSGKGAGNKVSDTITGRKDDVLFSYGQPVTAEIHGLRYDSSNHRWNASILFRAGEEVVSAVPATGTYEEVIDVPVLRREARNNNVISEGDLEMRAFPLAHTRSDTITNASDLIGKSPLRYISAQRPIRSNEISSPAVVKKGSLVQLQFVSSGIQISTTGQAMDDGAQGEAINVRNVASKRVVRAIVENEGNVRVMSSGSMPATSLTSNTPTPVITGGSHATN
jgi:flagella basal body P-ring formation protein FlgA